MRDRQRVRLGLIFVASLPLFTYPMSWLPGSWAHFRYDVVLPLPEIILAVALFLACATLLRKTTGESHAVDFALCPSRWGCLPLLAVLIDGVASTRFSEHSYFGLELLPRLGGNAAIFLLAANAPRDSMGPMRKLWMAVAVIVAANGLARLGSETEFVSTLGNRNFLGTYLAASVVIGTSLGGTWPLVGNFVLLTAMWLCESRGAWLALAAVAILWFLECGDRFLQRWMARAIIVLLLLISAGSLAQPYVLRQWRTEVRPMIWKATLHLIAARPVFGHGLGTYIAVYPKYRPPQYFLSPKATNVTDHPHNELLEVAAEQGLVGVAATLWLWATAVWCGIRAIRQSTGTERRGVLGLLGAMLVLMFHGMVDVDLRHLPNQSLLWLLMGLLVGAGVASERRAGIKIHSQPARWCAAAMCLALGIWVATTAVAQPLVADWRDREARIAEAKGDFGAAAQRAAAALRLQPFRLTTRYLLAGALSRLPDAQARELAIDQCLQIEQFAPDYADVTYNLGRLYLATNRTVESLPWLRRAVEIDPYDEERRVALATALHRLGRNDEAVQELNQALQMQPGRQDAGELRQKIQPERAP